MERVLYIILEVFVLLFMGCDSFAPKQPTVPFTTSSDSNFDLIFKYGIGAKNELDTFKNTYTKDLVVDPSIAVNITLSKEELGRIYQKMIEIDFFGYPNKFSVSAPPGEIGGMQTPYGSYYFRAKYDSKIKELWWEDEISLINEDEKGTVKRFV